MTETTIRVTTPDQAEVDRRFAEITANNEAGFSAVLAAKSAARDSANALARASRSMKATLLGAADSMKVTSAFGAAKNLLRSVAGRAGAAASKVGTIVSPGLLLSLVLTSKDARDTLYGLLRPVAGKVAAVLGKVQRAWYAGLRKVGLSRLAAWQERNVSVAVTVVGLAFHRAMSYLDSKQDSGAFRWARYFIVNKIANNVIKAILPAQYRTAAYVMWLLWGGSVVQKRNTTQAPPPFSESQAPSSAWKVTPVSLLGPATGKVFDAEEIITDLGDTIYRVTDDNGTTEYFTAAAMDVQVVPRGSVTLGANGATSDLELKKQQGIPVRSPRPRAPRTAAEAPKSSRTPKQAKKRPRKPPVAAVATAK